MFWKSLEKMGATGVLFISIIVLVILYFIVDVIRDKFLKDKAEREMLKTIPAGWTQEDWDSKLIQDADGIYSALHEDCGLFGYAVCEFDERAVNIVVQYTRQTYPALASKYGLLYGKGLTKDLEKYIDLGLKASIESIIH